LKRAWHGSKAPSIVADILGSEAARLAPALAPAPNDEARESWLLFMKVLGQTGEPEQWRRCWKSADGPLPGALEARPNVVLPAIVKISSLGASRKLR
jgi:hypothetical protein